MQLTPIFGIPNLVSAASSTSDPAGSEVGVFTRNISTAADVARIGSITETAPASDTASSGLNGRLQRIAQRLASIFTALSDKTLFAKLTDGTNNGTFEAGATYNSGIAPATKGLTVNARLQQIFALNHIDNALATATNGSTVGDDSLYAQNQDQYGNVGQNLSSIRGRSIPVVNIATGGDAKCPPPVPIGGFGRSSAPTAVTSGRNQWAYFDLNGRLCIFSDQPLPAGTNIIGKVTTDQTTHGTTDLVAADITKLAGTAIDVNSGNKSAGTVRVVLATDQPQLTNKFLVTPDPNSAVNVAQFGGTNVSTGIGNGGAGIPRVTVSKDSSIIQLTDKVLVSKGGSAAGSGNNTLVAAGTNKLKVYAFSLTTTSTTAITCIFQSGASGTELWRVTLQAISGGNVGANLAVSPPAWLFNTASATLLNLNLSSAQTVHWSVAYFDEA